MLENDNRKNMLEIFSIAILLINILSCIKVKSNFRILSHFIYVPTCSGERGAEGI